MTAKRRQIITILMTWLYCLLISGPPLFGWGKYLPEGLMTTCSFDFLSRDVSVSSFFLYLISLGFFTPLAMLVANYWHIWRRIRLPLPSKPSRSDEMVQLNTIHVVSPNNDNSNPRQNHNCTPKNYQPADICDADIQNLDDGIAPGDVQNSPPEKAILSTETSKRKSLLQQNRKLTSRTSKSTHTRLSREEAAESKPNLYWVRQKEYKIIKITVAVLAAFLFAWAPYAVLAMIGQFGPPGVIHPYVVAVAGLMAKSSTGYNPIIYGFIDSRFRNKCTTKIIICSFCIVLFYSMLMCAILVSL